MLKAVLFDMDGVLVDSEEYIRNAAIEMFREKGHTVRAKDFIPFIGCGENRFLGGVAEIYGIQIDIEKDKARTYLIYERICAGKLVALPGVFETMQLCKSLKLKTAVSTSADEFKMLVNLREIGIAIQTFDVCVFADMVINKKPDPEIFLCAAEMLHVDPAECLVIEDAPSGLQAARAAGMRSLALSTTFSADKLGMADWIIKDLSYVKRDFFDW